MTRTSSNMLPLGTILPSFHLPLVDGTGNDSKGNQERLSFFGDKDLKIRPTLIMFLCSHCPFVKHIESEITKLDRDYRENVNILAIASNSLRTHPQDAPENLLAQARKNNWTFPYLLDQDQEFAKSLRAACTPDFFVFQPSLDHKQLLRYRGQLDESRPGNDLKVTGQDLRLALSALLGNRQILEEQKPSIGCNIKWHPGNEPAWWGQSTP